MTDIVFLELDEQPEFNAKAEKYFVEMERRLRFSNTPTLEDYIEVSVLMHELINNVIELEGGAGLKKLVDTLKENADAMEPIEGLSKDQLTHLAESGALVNSLSTVLLMSFFEKYPDDEVIAKIAEEFGTSCSTATVRKLFMWNPDAIDLDEKFVECDIADLESEKTEPNEDEAPEEEESEDDSGDDAGDDSGSEGDAG